jgi:APA family basic amino acid/polyamine antiporter
MSWSMTGFGGIVNAMNNDEEKTQELTRAIGLSGAVMLGLGSILGTGVFVSLGIGAGIAGNMVLPALFLAGLIAVCNGMSSAQLAAAHPVSGGSYEYGYQFVSPVVGFTAGWMFLCAKSASAATAALGMAGYILNAIPSVGEGLHIPMAVGGTLLLTVVTLTGVQRSSRVNTGIVCLTLGALGFFVVAGLPVAKVAWGTHAVQDMGTLSFLEAAALMFVAYTGLWTCGHIGRGSQRPA